MEVIIDTIIKREKNDIYVEFSKYYLIKEKKNWYKNKNKKIDIWLIDAYLNLYQDVSS